MTTSVVLRIVALLTQVRPESNLGTVHKLVHFGSWKAFLLWSIVRLDTFQIHIAHKNHLFGVWGCKQLGSQHLPRMTRRHKITPKRLGRFNNSHYSYLYKAFSIFNLSNLVGHVVRQQVPGILIPWGGFPVWSSAAENFWLTGHGWEETKAI